jgi:hypothetical protein
MAGIVETGGGGQYRPRRDVQAASRNAVLLGKCGRSCRGLPWCPHDGDHDGLGRTTAQHVLGHREDLATAQPAGPASGTATTTCLAS